MSDVNLRFEHWFKFTHFSAPAPTLDDEGRYTDAAVQAMFIAYRAGFNRARKESKGRARYEFDFDRFRDATGA